MASGEATLATVPVPLVTSTIKSAPSNTSSEWEAATAKTGPARVRPRLQHIVEACGNRRLVVAVTNQVFGQDVCWLAGTRPMVAPLEETG